ncbi:MAG: ABC transporter permease [Bacteroidales bacterium]|nr:ABC transporter permease [Bacteroidales bacterium]
MLKHYLKVAFRNIWKYKIQSLISIVGLAVGFTCFALASLWIRYEENYDGFYKDADRIYLIREMDQVLTDSYSRGMMRSITPGPLAEHLRKNFPEVERSTHFTYSAEFLEDIEYNGHSFRLRSINMDTSFVKLFGFESVEGDLGSMDLPGTKIAITEKTARKIFGKEPALGKTLILFNNTEYTVSAVIRDLSGPSNFPFDVLTARRGLPGDKWHEMAYLTFVKLSPNSDIKNFKEKLKEIKVPVQYSMPTETGTVEVNFAFEPVPVARIRSDYPFEEPEVRQNHIRLFSLSGIILIVCSLFNFFTLFISRFRIRQKEFAIRLVNGSSLASLFILLLNEFIVILLFAVLLGVLFIRVLLPAFRLLSQVQTDMPVIYRESLLYTGGIILISILVFFLALLWFRKRTLSSSVRRSNHHLFRKASIVVQLVISIGFIFCTSVMQRQLRHLHTVDLGFDYKNIGQITIFPSLDSQEWASQILRIPGIKKAVTKNPPLMPASSRGLFRIDKDGTEMQMVKFDVLEDFFEIYGLRLLDGAFLTADDPENLIVITETTARLLNLQHPVGEKISHYMVKGVVKNIYNASPVLPPKPIIFTLSDSDRTSTSNLIFSYEGDTWEGIKKNIDKWREEHHSQSVYYDLVSSEDAYNDYFRSEEALLKLLGFISLVCIIISVFGFVSLVMLTCEERRKEIAIRKVNGAEVRDILFIFLKEYFLLLLVGTVIAFPAGYLIMKPWIEQYTLQTIIPTWIYGIIFLSLFVIIVFCVGWKIIKTANENPAEVVKADN